MSNSTLYGDTKPSVALCADREARYDEKEDATKFGVICYSFEKRQWGLLLPNDSYDVIRTVLRIWASGEWGDQNRLWFTEPLSSEEALAHSHTLCRDLLPAIAVNLCDLTGDWSARLHIPDWWDFEVSLPKPEYKVQTEIARLRQS